MQKKIAATYQNQNQKYYNNNKKQKNNVKWNGGTGKQFIYNNKYPNKPQSNQNDILGNQRMERNNFISGNQRMKRGDDNIPTGYNESKNLHYKNVSDPFVDDGELYINEN